MSKKRILAALLITISLAACGDKDNHSTRRAKLQEFRFETHLVGVQEHVIIMDVPDTIGGTRCVIYSNEKTNTSNLICDLMTPRDMLLDIVPPKSDIGSDQRL